ncbi:heterokaryon incompatibility protein-domain-containing protein [Aspergillus minisclerotigenes]|uniref:Heterokaryon incompatibility protein-domain-containing protein n=1 Tax=Aspergillus minisclerotigenes TaxID=656917 RepID=A0A5N6IYI2_9EURO|nr:heterokaryon incompatibility protein-domain-containing protein [Aspergillus minisclerotigenes]
MDCGFCEEADRGLSISGITSSEAFHTECHDTCCCPSEGEEYQRLCPRCRHLRLPHLAKRVAFNFSDTSIPPYINVSFGWTKDYDGEKVKCHLCHLIAHTAATSLSAVRRDLRTSCLCAIVVTRRYISVSVRSDEIKFNAGLVLWSELPQSGRYYLRSSGDRVTTPETTPILGQYVDWGKVRSLLNSSSTPTSGLSLESGRPAGLKVVNVQQDRVVEAPVGCEYIALSYVFGSSTTIDLTPSGSFNRYNLPATIRDAIVACYKLGFKYLWVDQLCINQSDPVDQLHQINQMSRIYECAAYTVVALAGEDSSHGLPGVTKARSWSYKCIRIGNYGITALAPSLQFCMENSKWYTRGWTFQEAMFSSRLILFTSYGVHCGFQHRNYTRLMSETEFGTSLNALALPMKGDYWQALEQYTTRDLTFPSDILRAFTAVLRSIHGEDTYYGLPSREIDRAILWTPAKFTSVPTSRRHGFPTWSWASHCGPISRPKGSAAGLAVWALPRGLGTEVIFCTPRPGHQWDWLFLEEQDRMRIIASALLTGCLQNNLHVDAHLATPVCEQLYYKWPDPAAYWEDVFGQYRHDEIFSPADVRIASLGARILVYSQTAKFLVDPNSNPSRGTDCIRSKNGDLSGYVHIPQYELHSSTSYMGEFLAISVSQDCWPLELAYHDRCNPEYQDYLSFTDGKTDCSKRMQQILSPARGIYYMLHVMLIRRDEQSNVARRVGIGEIFLRKWAEAERRFEAIVLE